MQLSGKRIWVIGASAGIGEAVVRELAAAGAILALSARNAEALQKLAQDIGGGGALATTSDRPGAQPQRRLSVNEEPLVKPLDVTNIASINAARDALLSAWGQIDMLVFVAGVYTPLRATNLDIEAAEKIFAINYHGAFACVASVLPDMLAKKSGHIVLFSSVAGFRGLPNAIGYGASKAALTHLAETLKIDLEDKGITVQVVHPGFVKTRLTDQNPFAMPFLITAEEAGRRTVAGIRSGRFEIHFPRRFTYFMKLLRILPYPVYFWVVRNLL